MTLIQILENTADLILKVTSASYYLDTDLLFSTFHAQRSRGTYESCLNLWPLGGELLVSER